MKNFKGGCGGRLRTCDKIQEDGVQRESFNRTVHGAAADVVIRRCRDAKLYSASAFNPAKKQ